MAEAHFNELSCLPLTNDRTNGNKLAYNLAKVLAEAKRHGFNVVRCSEKGTSDINISKDYTLTDFYTENIRDSRAILIMSMMRPPYFAPDSEEEARYISGQFTLTVPAEITPERETSVYGLAAAAIYNSISISFESHAFWTQNKVLELIEKTDHKTCSHNAINLSCTDDFNHQGVFLAWCLKNRFADFPDCGIEPKNKKCSLSSDHHGNNELKQFAKNSLFKLPYIKEVSTSLRYSPNTKSFVKAIQINEGKHPTRIEVVLHWHEAGYAMLVETTARNALEAYQIAYELEKKFGNEATAVNTIIDVVNRISVNH